MQVGFAMLEVGSVSPKNTKAVLIKNVGDAAIGAICWWLLGYGFAYGHSIGGFMGASAFALRGNQFENPDGGPSTPENGYKWAYWLFNWAFAATSATIVSGAIAERVKVTAYIVYSIAISSVIYPIVVHWVWDSEGWASSTRPTDDLLFECGAIDFAGSGVVHMVGGTCSVVAAIVAKPRARRFNEDGSVNKMPQQSPALQTLGTLILWCGWYGFNGGSCLYVTDGRSVVAAKAMVSSTIAPSAGACMLVVLVKMLQNKFDSSLVNNGILAGLVAITAGCPVVAPEAAMIIGAVAGCIYFVGSKLILRLRIDDVVDATPVHLFSGLWGVLAVGLFATPNNYQETYPEGGSERAHRCCGAFYGCGGRLLGAQIVYALAILAWVGGMSLILFLGIKYTIGMRVSLQEEETGMDKTRHGGRKTSEALKKALAKAGIDATAMPSRQPSMAGRRPMSDSSHRGSIS
ncbi:unnamed protein product [Phaeothamnion confervicola]